MPNDGYADDDPIVVVDADGVARVHDTLLLLWGTSHALSCLILQWSHKTMIRMLAVC